MAYAFRCRNCNSLEEAAHAGENAIPRRCRSCGKGGSFDPDSGLFVVDEANWVKLAELTPAELQPILDYHQIDASEIEAHAPFTTQWTKQDRVLQLDYDDGSSELVADSSYEPTHTPLGAGQAAPVTRAPRLVSVRALEGAVLPNDAAVATVATEASSAESAGTTEGAMRTVVSGGQE